MNTVWAIAGGDSRIVVSTLTDDQNALHTAKVNELLSQHGTIWCGGGWSKDRSRNKLSQHAGYQNRDWMDPTK